MKISSSEFKEKCPKILKDIGKYTEEVIITNKGKPIAVLKAYVKPQKEEVFGCMRGSMKILGDIIEPINEEWDGTMR